MMHGAVRAAVSPVGFEIMGLSVVFVSGIRRSGKTALIQHMIERLFRHAPHYLRLARLGGDKIAPNVTPETNKAALEKCKVASARWLPYSEDRVIEILAQTLTEIHKKDRYGSVIIEADAESGLRHAYPWDHRIFVMPLPAGVSDVFRDPQRAAEEFRQVLDDTAAFATEIFGMFEDGPEDDEPHEQRDGFSKTQMRRFLNSPLGDELATRIQLQQPYHGLVESDVIVVNKALGKAGSEADQCLHRIERLLSRTCDVSGKRPELFHCDPNDPECPECKRLMKTLKPMCGKGK